MMTANAFIFLAHTRRLFVRRSACPQAAALGGAAHRGCGSGPQATAAEAAAACHSGGGRGGVAAFA